MPKDTGIGASTRRREDVRFLKGKGQYTDDIPPAHDQAAAVFARSTVANGVIKSIDTSVAESMPGVLAVLPVPISPMLAATPQAGLSTAAMASR